MYMRVNIDGAPAYAIAYCFLEAGETVFIENGGMALMSEGIQVNMSTGGGLSKGLMRKAFGGESLIMGAYKAEVSGAWVAASPKYPGDVRPLDLSTTGSLLAQSGALLAFDDRVDVSVRPSSVSSALATRGVTLLKMSGLGIAVIGTYGAISEFDVKDGQSVIVDTGHLVAFSENMDIETGFLGGIVTSAATGEALVSKLHGPGHVYIQTRAEEQLFGWINPQRNQNEK